MNLKYIISFLILLKVGFAQSQLIFINAPKNGAFIAQNKKTKKGEYLIQGFVNNNGFSNLEIAIYKSGVNIKTHKRKLHFAGGIANFNQKIELDAGKYFYTITYSLTGSSTYSQTVNSIMVGDVYLIQGQSNAAAGDYGLPSIYNTNYNDTFIRSFGNSNPNSYFAQTDTNWHKINATGFYNSGCVGEWGAVMAKNLLDSFNIPICLINGAVGGTSISQHMPTFGNSLNLNSIYGRLLYRTQKAQLQNNITGIIYYQGESDGANAKLHDSLFKIINTNWNKDFKGFKKLYVVQVRGGCGNPSLALREVQRKFEFTLNKCKTLSANGMNNGDGCHFGFVDGYELLGKQLAALISRDIYGSNRKTNIDPPNIKSAYYSNANQTEITLNLQNPNDTVNLDNYFYSLFKIEGDNTVTISNGFKRNNKIVLQLNKNSCNITGLSYDGRPLSQPWVKNIIGMGLLSFYDLPILKHQIKPFYQGCRKIAIEMGEDSVNGYLYQWKRLANNKIYKTAKIKILSDSVEKFELIITYGNSACKKRDTLIVYLSQDPILLPELGVDKTICLNDTLTLNPNNLGFLQFLWQNNKTTSTAFTFKTSSTSKIVLTATSQQLCVYKDSVNITVSKPQISLPKNAIICSGKDTLIQVEDTFVNYFWNNKIGTNKYKANEGKLNLKATNKFGCIAQDSCIIKSFVPINKLNITETICLNKVAKIGKPQNIKNWYYQNILIADSLAIRPNNFYSIILEDSNLCKLLDTIKIIPIPIPQFNLGRDTGFCVGKNYTIILPSGMSYYEWNNVEWNKNIFQINTNGPHIFKVINQQNCAFTDSIHLTSYGLPNLSQFYDSALCVGTQWKITLPNYNSYSINLVVYKDSFILKTADNFNITATNSNFCVARKTIDIQMVKCNVNANIPKIEPIILIYPNPFASNLTIKSNTAKKIQFMLLDKLGKIILEGQTSENEISLNLLMLNEGVYFLKANNVFYKLIKIKE